LYAACVPYYFSQDNDWRYYWDYNVRDELVLKRNGDEYSYCLITYSNYTPLATLALLGSVCVTACVCVAAHLIKRKKIPYEF
ncbi:MAG: hypothetical protein K2K04_05665, partial [Clostridia bacterium]|nr:hypothetical protein [Clostridia bacterium]